MRERVAAAQRGKPKPQCREMMLRRYATGWLPPRHGRNHDTGPELIVEGMLKLLGIAYEKQKRTCGYVVDFYVPSEKLVIEAFGCYWHSCPTCFDDEPRPGMRQHDASRIADLEEAGYTVVVLWEHDLL